MILLSGICKEDPRLLLSRIRILILSVVEKEKRKLEMVGFAD